MKKAEARLARARFLWSVLRWEEAPSGGWAEVAFAGRSNVGKSSLINSLLGRKGLARTSSTPGRTQTLNFFLVEERFVLVDLPGYGYARAPREEVRRWMAATADYITRSPSLRGVVVLFDIRREPSPEDHRFVERARSAGRRLVPVVTKCDKVSRGERSRRVKQIARALGFAPEDLVLTSSRLGDGRDLLWARLDDLLQPAADTPVRREGAP